MMRLTNRVRSVSYLKAHAAEVLRDLAELQEPLIVTQNGEARAVLLDVAAFDQLQETVALIKLLSLADRQATDGMVQTAADAVAAFRSAEG
jgi:prevent-host-death family protein